LSVGSLRGPELEQSAMKNLIASLVLILISAGFSKSQSDNVEFICLKTHKASNICYFNFKVDGGKYSYTDIGCKKVKKKDEVIKKAREGKLALAKDWKIECPEVKDNTSGR
jgi:hypothetical protein